LQSIPPPPPNSPHPSLTWLYSLIEYLLQTICNGDWLWTARPCQAGRRAAVVADWLMERAGNGSGSRARVVAGGRVVGIAIVTRYKGRGERAESVVAPVAARRRDLNRVKRRPPPARRVCPASIQMKNPNRVLFHAHSISPEKQIDTSLVVRRKLPRVVGDAVLRPGRVQIVILTETLPATGKFTSHLAVHQAVEEGHQKSLQSKTVVG
jgi:hypothetical protein